MVADPLKYVGREQALVKRYFLKAYLESLIYKTASAYDEVVYVDGFSGPWQSTGEDFEDTSFGIALDALRKAKASWKERGRDVCALDLVSCHPYPSFYGGIRTYLAWH